MPADRGGAARDDTERRLLNDFQRHLPLDPRPFRAVGECLGIGEDEVLRRLRNLHAAGAVSRVGPVFAANRIGASTLAAMAVPPERLVEVAAMVNRFPEVNHNYERDHAFNLWFVVTAADRRRIDEVLAEISRRSGIEPLDLPMVEDYFIDLGFPLEW